MIISNQIKCNKCGDEIYSTHVHDFVNCSCDSVAVDGGQHYLRRVGSDYTDMSLVYDDEFIEKLDEQLEWCDDTGRNNFGRICAILRSIRDQGFKIVPNEENK